MNYRCKHSQTEHYLFDEQLFRDDIIVTDWILYKYMQFIGVSVLTLACSK